MAFAMYTLKDYVHQEILGKKNDKFSWLKAFKTIRKNREENFVFWYRVAYILHRKGGSIYRKLAKSINNRIKFKYCCDLDRRSTIDIGLKIGHLSGIVVTPKVKIGKNFTIRQCTTIGRTERDTDHEIEDYEVVIGNNVTVGANSCIIGNGLTLGDDITIGAMSFVNKDIPSGSIYYTEKSFSVKSKD